MSKETYQSDFSVFDQPIVGEHRNVLRFCLFDDCGRRFGVDRVEDQNFGTLGQGRFRLALLFGSVLIRVAVEDFAVFAFFFDLFFEFGLVMSFVARSFVLGKKECDLRTATTRAATATRHDQASEQQEPGKQ